MYTYSKPVIRHPGSVHVVLVEPLLGCHHALNKVDIERRQNEPKVVEVVDGGRLPARHLPREHLDQEPVVAVVAPEAVDHVVEVGVGELGGLGEHVVLVAEFGRQPLEAGDEVGVGQVLDDVGAVEDPARLKIKQGEKIKRLEYGMK